VLNSLHLTKKTLTERKNIMNPHWKTIGLCVSCQHTKMVESSKGSRFYLCELSKIDDSYPKYPATPVVFCDGYQPNMQFLANLSEPQTKQP
jgi:hypothetical protein